MTRERHDRSSRRKAPRISLVCEVHDQPLQYYLRVAYGPQRVWLYPGVAQDLLGTPYFVVRREGVDVVR